MVTTKTTTNKMQMTGEAKSPADHRPWEDPTLSAQERYDSYKAVVREHCQRIYDAGTREGVTQEERYAMSQDPENRRWKSELERLEEETPERFCYRIDGVAQKELLGRSFLGAEAWRVGFGVDVGPEHPFPKMVTEELLEKECPLHPGKKIKQTHILVFIPKTVDGEPYTALKLDELCSRGEDKLINQGLLLWKNQSWTSLPQSESRWAFLPIDPDSAESPKQHFRNKDVSAQGELQRKYLPEYQEVRALELMTAVLLNYAVYGEPRMPGKGIFLRCKEPGTSGGGRVCIGDFSEDGLTIFDGVGGHANPRIGLALDRKLNQSVE